MYMDSGLVDGQEDKEDLRGRVQSHMSMRMEQIQTRAAGRSLTQQTRAPPECARQLHRILGAPTARQQMARMARRLSVETGSIDPAGRSVLMPRQEIVPVGLGSAGV
jgi:hypothetical protein